MKQPKDWRQELQKELDTNNALRQAAGVYRVGDALTETNPCLEGAGRPREIER